MARHFDWRRAAENLGLWYLGMVICDLAWGAAGPGLPPDALWVASGAIMLIGFRVCEWAEERWFLRRLEAEEDEEDEGP